MTLRLWNGRVVDPFEIEQYWFTPDEFAHPLACINRYAGHLKAPVSVAEHSVLLSEVVPPHLRRTALLHDCSEALVQDLPSNIKARLPDYVAMEERIQRHLFGLWCMPWEHMEELHPYDRRFCQDEGMQGYLEPADFGMVSLGVTIQFWDWRTAREQMLIALNEEGML